MGFLWKESGMFAQEVFKLEGKFQVISLDSIKPQWRKQSCLNI